MSTTMILFAVGSVRTEELPPSLPGPGLELPVDVDGDGTATWGDSYVFNLWLEMGGTLKAAIAAGVPTGGFLDLSDFFHSSQAALSDKAAVLKGKGGGLNGGVALAQVGGDCPETGGFLEGDFDQGVTQVYTIVCDDDLLENANAQAIRTVDESIYVTRRVNSSDGGVARLQGVSVEGDGRFSALVLTNVASNICKASKIAYDVSNDDFVVTQNTSLQGECGGAQGQVKRLTNLDGTVTVCDEFAAGTVVVPEGIGVFKQAHACEAQVGDLAISNHRPEDSTDSKSGNVRWTATQNTSCSSPPPSPGGRVINRFANAPTGLDIGDFNGTGTLGVYVGISFTQNVFDPGISRLTAVDPAGAPPCTWEGSATPLHAITSATPDAVVFDPYSPFLFATIGTTAIEIIRPEAEADVIPFADGFDFSNGSGISFPHSGIMLVSELNQVVAIDGFRFKFRRGDADADNQDLDLTDGTTITDWLFQGGAEAGCWDAADANDDAQINVTDAVFIFNFLFNGGDEPPAPGPDETLGVDPTEDLFGCRQYHDDGRILE